VSNRVTPGRSQRERAAKTTSRLPISDSVDISCQCSRIIRGVRDDSFFVRAVGRCYGGVTVLACAWSRKYA
jgi:hypothetical protein